MWIFQLAFGLFVIGSHIGLIVWFAKFFAEMHTLPIYAICWTMIAASILIVLDALLWASVQPALFPIVPR